MLCKYRAMRLARVAQAPSNHGVTASMLAAPFSPQLKFT